MYASTRVGPTGRVLAVDLQEITTPLGANVTVLRGDALAAEPPEVSAAGPFDVVLSDMAPATTGSKPSDGARSAELFGRALDIAIRHGKPGASFVGKIFMSEDFPPARARVKSLFRECRVIKPEGTRSNSTEVFVVGLGLERQKPTA